jgi:hypothetical protein
MRNVAFGALVSLLVGVACGGRVLADDGDGGSGGDDSGAAVKAAAEADCMTKGSCPNDTTPVQVSVVECQSALNGSCGMLYATLIQCAFANVECNAAGESELPAGACESEEAAYADCLGPTSVGGGQTYADAGISYPDAGSGN